MLNREPYPGYWDLRETPKTAANAVLMAWRNPDERFAGHSEIRTEASTPLAEPPAEKVKPAIATGVHMPTRSPHDGFVVKGMGKKRK